MGLTEWETSLISRATVLSRRVCPTRPITARPVVFSTLPSKPSVLLSTSVGAERSFPRGSTSVSSTLSTHSAVKFLDRVQANDAKKKAANAEGKRVVLKRGPRQPRAAHTVQAKDNVPQLITPIPYEFIC